MSMEILPSIWWWETKILSTSFLLMKVQKWKEWVSQFSIRTYLLKWGQFSLYTYLLKTCFLSNYLHRCRAFLVVILVLKRLFVASWSMLELIWIQKTMLVYLRWSYAIPYWQSRLPALLSTMRGELFRNLAWMWEEIIPLLHAGKVSCMVVWNSWQMKTKGKMSEKLMPVSCTIEHKFFYFV